jgi:hypothetical protein
MILSRVFSGISYILQGIPYVNVVGLFLVPISWIIEGAEHKRKLWIVTGALGLLTIGLFIAGIALALTALSPEIMRVASNPQIGVKNITSEEVKKLVSSLTPNMLSSGLVLGASLVTGIAYFVLMVVSLFQAGDVYLTNTLKIGAVLFIVGFLFALSGSAYLMVSMSGIHGSHVPAALEVYLFYLAAIFTSLLASIVSGIGFLIARNPK